MGTLERRQREREDTRRRILDAARDMFVRRGYEATTMRAIAQKVEYTPTAIYHHFRNKDALLNELCSIDFRALAQTFLRVGRVEDPLERLTRIGEAYVEFADAHPMQYQLMFMTQRPWFKLENEGEPGDPSEDAYAQIAWGSMHGIVALRIVKGEYDWIAWRDLRETARTACQTMVRGMLAIPPD